MRWNRKGFADCMRGVGADMLPVPQLHLTRRCPLLFVTYAELGFWVRVGVSVAVAYYLAPRL